MGEDPDAIRDEIVDTRMRMGETIDALGHKADVKARAKERVSDTVGGVKEKLGVAGQRAGDAAPDPEQVKHQVRRAAGLAQENPLGLAVGAVAAGFLVGLAVPSSNVEHEKLGPVADRVKDQAKETGQEAFERGKEVAQSAAQTVSEEGRKHGEELADSARENAASLRE
jgi:gas vesicle protein